MSYNIGDLPSFKDKSSLKEVLDQSIVGTYVIQDGTFAYVNDTFAEWFGFEPEEIIEKKTPMNLTADKDKEKVSNKIDQRLSGDEKSLQYSFLALRKDNSTFEAEVHGTVTNYGDSEAIVGTLRKVHESNRAEKVIEDLAWGVANHTGKAFYRLLVVHLASCLNAELAYIGDYDPAEDTFQTLAFFNDGDLDDSFSFNSDHPASKEILRSGSCKFENAKLEFPNDNFFQQFNGEGFFGTTLINSVGDIVGVIWIMARSKLNNLQLVRDVLQIFADRAGAEIERSRTELKRQESEAKYKTVFESVKDGILVVDPSSGEILNANKKSFELFKYDNDELIGMNIDELSASDTSYNPGDFLNRTGRDGPSEKPFEWHWQNSNGESFWGEVTLTSVDLDGVTRLLAVIRDVNLRIQTEEALSNPSPLDPVTDTATRSYFYEELENSLNDSEGPPKTGVLFLDIDGFKQVNNTFGREIGDRILRDLTKQMQSRLGDKGIIARWGGDEFVILLPYVLDVPNAESIARELLDIYESPIFIAGEEFHLSASMGIAIYPENADGSGELVSNAELAMFKAKEKKGNTYRVFTEESSRDVKKQFKLQTEIREALKKDQFEVHFQPQFDLANGSLAGVEALVRWHHPKKGYLYPKEFIPVAETRGLIVDIDKKAMKQSTKVVSSHNKHTDCDLRLSVNVSPHHFENHDLIDIVKSIISDSGLQSDNLVLEITETVAMKDIEFTCDLLNQLKTIGVKIALDDFGTGYASFSNLSRLPIDMLKIDRSLVNLMGTRQEEFKVVKIINPLAEELGLNVIAEGVETRKQLEIIKKWNCTEAQGYLLSKPLPNLNLQQLIDVDPRVSDLLGSNYQFVNVAS